MIQKTRFKAVWLTLFLALANVSAQTTAFNYQGRLTDGGNPASGAFLMQFMLFDSVAAGGQVGSTINDVAVTVVQGTFSVKLDFGSNPLSGANRWLEIAVRRNSGESYVMLSPREQIASSPYAVQTFNAQMLGGIPASEYVTNATVGSSFIRNGTTLQTGNFNISGNGTAGGTLSANVVNAATQFNIGGAPILRNIGFDNLLIGKSAGVNNPTGLGNTLVGLSAGFNTSTGSDNTFVGDNAGNFNSGGNLNTFLGAFTGQDNTTGNANTIIGAAARLATGNLNNATAIGSQAVVSQSNSIVLGAIAGEGPATTSTNVGIGTTSPVARLDVNAINSGSIALKTNGSSWFKGDTTPLSVSQTGNGEGVVIGSVGGYGYIAAWDYGLFQSRNLVLNRDGGNVGINTNAPTLPLDVNGRARIRSIPIVGTTTATVCFNALGDLLQCNASSLKWKTNVYPFSPGLKTVLELRPIRFNWKDDGQADFGLVAEDVARTAPDLVLVNEKGEAEGVKYEKLNLLLINAVKEQQAQIERLEQQVKNLRRLICRKSLRLRECRGR